MKISVVIPSIRDATIAEAVRAIQTQTHPDWELLVIAQGEQGIVQSAVDVVAAADRRVRCHYTPIHGLSHARNIGVSLASGDAVAFTDDDCTAHPQWLEVIEGYFAREPRIDVVGGCLIAPPRKRSLLARCPALNVSDELYQPFESARQPPTGWDWLGANVAMRRHLLERHGFDECLGAGTELPAGEDTDLKLRFEAMGVWMQSTPLAIVQHTHGYRYGIRALVAHARAYVVGNAALAAKLTLLNDPRGAEWVAETRRECLGRAFRTAQIYRLPYDFLRFRLYAATYARVVAQYEVDARGWLHRRTGEAAPTA